MEKPQLLELIAAGQAGDRSAQEKLITEIQNRIYYQCKKMLKNEEDALDATQDILISVLTGLDKLREPEAFYGWVSGITANRCKHLLTQGTKEWQIPEDGEGNSLLDQYEDLDQVVPDRAVDNEETRNMIVQLVEALPEAQRMTVLLYYYDELSVRDIASAMETTEGTVKSRLNYARKAIKEGVEDYEKKGIKLYGMSPLPLLLYFLRKDAAINVLTKETAFRLTASAVGIPNATGVTTGAAAGIVPGTVTATPKTAACTATVAGSASSSMATGVAVAAGAAAKISGTALGVKIAAAVTAAAILGGGIAVVANRETAASAPTVTETATPDPSPTVAMGSESSVAFIEVDKLWGNEPPTKGDYVDTSYREDTSSLYYNDQTFFLIYNEAGDTFSVGLSDPTKTEAIYLNIHESSGRRTVGYYIRSSRNEVLYNSEMKWAPLSSEQNQGCSNFVINRTYDELIPAEGTAVRWANDLLFDTLPDTSTDLFVRAIDLMTGQMLSTFKIEISQIMGSYRIMGILSTDVGISQDLSAEDRAELLDNAIALARNDILGLDARVRDDLSLMTDNEVFATGKVEYLDDAMYFNKCLSPTGLTVLSSRYTRLYQGIYAVTFSTSRGGHFTMYYSPDVDDELEEVILDTIEETYGEDVPEDLAIPPLGPVTAKEVRFFATDLYKPETKGTFAPAGFFN